MNEDKKWFRAHKYGYGYGPATWEGGMGMFVYFVFLGFTTWKLVGFEDTQEQPPISFFILIGLATVILLTVCVKKGDKLTWRWGDKMPPNQPTQRDKKLFKK